MSSCYQQTSWYKIQSIQSKQGKVLPIKYFVKSFLLKNLVKLYDGVVLCEILGTEDCFKDVSSVITLTNTGNILSKTKIDKVWTRTINSA